MNALLAVLTPIALISGRELIQFSGPWCGSYSNGEKQLIFFGLLGVGVVLAVDAITWFLGFPPASKVRILTGFKARQIHNHDDQESEA